ncbi:MAG: dihydroneopterin aldolase [Proteobacteria bacterium]|nr:dihydroneopterin aldolase [Burkholderiales bacterium]
MTDPTAPDAPPDTIFIRELRHQTLIGVYPWEREVTQAVELDLDFDLPGRHAADSRRLDDTIDYSQVVARVRAILDRHDEQLLETLSELIADTLLAEFRMPRLRLSLAKLNLMPGVKKLGITIERRRPAS